MNKANENTSPRTTPIGLARYAKDFFDAALAADEVLGTRPGYEIIAPIPVMYLVGHSIELILKSYLLHEGIELGSLKKKPFGHNLQSALEKAESLGLSEITTIDETDREVLEVLNELYASKQLNYIETGAKQFPSFGPLQTLTKKLIHSIAPHVGYTRPGLFSDK